MAQQETNLDRYRDTHAKGETLQGKSMKCLRCGESIDSIGVQKFKLGDETLFFSGLNRLTGGSVTMHMYRCHACGKAEFYLPGAAEAAERYRP